jgi:site-specific DNA-adenine methylase
LAKVYFKTDAEISIPDAAIEYAKRILAGEITIQEDDLKMKYEKLDGSHYKISYKGSNGSYWGSQCYGGYAGLVHTADKIKKFIPKSKIYVEPFAGLARTVELHHDRIILNDLSDYVLAELHKKFDAYPHVLITKEQFTVCIKRWDSTDTFFLFDPPHRTSAYTVNQKTFCDRTDTQYFKELRDLLPTLKGKWILCSDASRTGERIFRKTLWYKTIVESDKNVIFGKKSKILLVSNIPISNEKIRRG